MLELYVMASDMNNEHLIQQVGNIVKALHRQMKEKSIKTRQGCFSLLTELILVIFSHIKKISFALEN